MVSTKRLLLIILTIILGLGLVVPVSAASKKTVYVLTKEKSKSYSSNPSYTIKYTYDKNGLLKQIKYNNTDKYSYKGKISYKKGRAVKQSYVLYRHGVKEGKYQVDYKYTKAGYVKRATVFYINKKNKKEFISAYYITWNKKGKVVKDHIYWDNEDAYERYKYDKKGKYIGGHGYDNNGDSFKYVCKFPKKNIRDILEYSYDEYGEKYFQQTYRQKFVKGRLISETRFCDEYYYPEVLEEKRTFSYKKLKVSPKNYKKVLKQQKSLDYIVDYY